MLTYDCIIIGGSYAGLSAALSLGRALRSVLVIDAGNPCNKFAEAAHNIAGAEGKSPRRILEDIREELKRYATVKLLEGVVHAVKSEKHSYHVQTISGENFDGRKVLFATGVSDLLPDIPGFADCWGKSIVHCPFCHGYELRDLPTAILANGEEAMNYVRLLRAWTNTLYLFTQGKKKLKKADSKWLEEAGISVEETEIRELIHTEGRLQAVLLKDDRSFLARALYHTPEFRQANHLAISLGCKTDKSGLLETDTFHATHVKGVYAAGDCASSGRSIAQAVAAGSVAGIFITKALMHELSG